MDGHNETKLRLRNAKSSLAKNDRTPRGEEVHFIHRQLFQQLTNSKNRSIYQLLETSPPWAIARAHAIPCKSPLPLLTSGLAKENKLPLPPGFQLLHASRTASPFSFRRIHSSKTLAHSCIRNAFPKSLNTCPKQTRISETTSERVSRSYPNSKAAIMRACRAA